MRGRGGVDHQCFGITNIREMAGEFHVLNKFLPGLLASANTKTENCSGAIRQILLGRGMMGMAWKTWIVDPLYRVVGLQKLRDR